MKTASLFIIILALLAAVIPMQAQDNPNLITLNDATPAIDVVITLPADTTGTLALDISQAVVTLTDANEAVVFYAADQRLHGLEFNIAPNSGSHTLTVERLPNITEAYVSVVSLPEMTLNGTVQTIESNSLTFNQEIALPLNADSPGGSVAVNVPAETIGVVTATFPDANATSQFVDSDGVILAASTGGHVDGMTFVVDAGDYELTILGNNLSDTIIAGIRAVPVVEGGFAVIEAPAAPMVDVISETVADCTATITATSVNLRSGPGTGYSVMDYGYRGETLTVGGRNPENNWVVVGTDDGSAWVSMGVAQMDGTCNDLTVFNIPLRDAIPAQVIVATPEYAAPIVQYVEQPYTEGEYEEYEEYEDDDDYEEDHGDEEHDDD